MPSGKGESTKQDYQPAIMFYVDDWLESPDLKLVSMAAQGLWIHLLCRMWKSPRRGYLLKANASRPSAEEIGKWTGQPKQTIEQLLSEIEAEKVCSKTEDGILYSRRLVRIAKHHADKVRAGRKGGLSRSGSKSQRIGLPTVPVPVPITTSVGSEQPGGAARPTEFPAPAGLGESIPKWLRDEAEQRDRLEELRGAPDGPSAADVLNAPTPLLDSALAQEKDSDAVTPSPDLPIL